MLEKMKNLILLQIGKKFGFYWDRDNKHQPYNEHFKLTKYSSVYSLARTFNLIEDFIKTYNGR